MRWIAVLILLTIPIVASAQESKAEMCRLADGLTRVAKAVDAFARDPRRRTDRLTEKLTGAELVRLATEHDPRLLTPVKGYIVIARVEGRNSSVLVCQNNRSLLEDAGCTAEADIHRWQHVPLLPCGFSLDLAALCEGSGKLVEPVNNPCL